MSPLVLTAPVVAILAAGAVLIFGGHGGVVLITFLLAAPAYIALGYLLSTLRGKPAHKRNQDDLPKRR